jgi:hypothetical protein
MQLEQDKQVMLVTTVKKRVLEGEGPAVAVKRRGPGVGTHQAGLLQEIQSILRDPETSGPVIVGLDFTVLRWRR